MLFYDSTTYMMGVIFMAAFVAIVVGISVGDLRRKSTNPSSVIASLVLTIALLTMIVCLPATHSWTHSSTFGSTAAIIELMLVLTSAILAGIGLVQFLQSHRYRRGRKRAIFTLVGDLALGALLIYQLQQFRDEASAATAERRRLRAPQAATVEPGPPTVVGVDPAQSTPKPKAAPAQSASTGHVDRE